MYSESTHNVLISVMPVYLDDRSDPSTDHYFWAYRIHIENNRNDQIQLINRYWRITNQEGQIEEVHGAGVVGEQPVLAPGESYEYTSGCPLNTPSGIMVGHYEFHDQEKQSLIINVPAFSLDLPDAKPVYN